MTWLAILIMQIHIAHTRCNLLDSALINIQMCRHVLLAVIYATEHIIVLLKYLSKLKIYQCYINFTRRKTLQTLLLNNRICSLKSETEGARKFIIMEVSPITSIWEDVWPF